MKKSNNFNRLNKSNENTSLSLEEKWLDNQQVCKILRVSTRTLQDYRDQGVLSFSQYGKKIYYRADDIELHLENHYVKSWRR